MFRGITEPPRSQKPHLALHHATQLPVLFPSISWLKMGSHLDSHHSNVLSAWLVASDYSKAPHEVLATLINLRGRYWLAQIPISQMGNEESHRQDNLTLCKWGSQKLNLNLLTPKTPLFLCSVWSVILVSLCASSCMLVCVHMHVCRTMHVCVYVGSGG